ncbi:MAG: NAD(P)/FAD-dependent oxidoreductase [Deltaproteobacteria bacterium]|nr:NAD(P)/FAD-dependent oxidoreductase [Deltaproteobacteria bacterium]
MSGAVYDAIVLGGGPNGLLCGAYLARAGHRVALLERRHETGGGLNTEEYFGFRFNLHAVYHLMAERMPAYRDLDLASLGVRYVHPPVVAAFPLRDGQALVFTRDVEETARSIAGLSVADAAAYRRMWDEFQPMLDEYLVPMTLRPAEAGALTRWWRSAPRRWARSSARSPSSRSCRSSTTTASAIRGCAWRCSRSRDVGARPRRAARLPVPDLPVPDARGGSGQRRRAPAVVGDLPRVRAGRRCGPRRHRGDAHRGRRRRRERGRVRRWLTRRGPHGGLHPQPAADLRRAAARRGHARGPARFGRGLAVGGALALRAPPRCEGRRAIPRRCARAAPRRGDDRLPRPRDRRRAARPPAARRRRR